MFSLLNFNLCDVRMRIAIACVERRPQGSYLKNKSVSGGSFIRVKSVEEELNIQILMRACIIDFAPNNVSEITNLVKIHL